MSAVSENITPSYDAYPLDIAAIVRLFIVGIFAGALGWVLYLAISHFFVEPVFCRSAETFSVCNNGGTIAWVSAHIIVLAVLVAALARMATYRPLLVALGVMASLWGAHAWLGGMAWYMGMLWQALLFGLAVMVFGWIARTASFGFAVIASLIIVVIARVVLLAA